MQMVLAIRSKKELKLPDIAMKDFDQGSETCKCKKKVNTFPIPEYHERIDRQCEAGQCMTGLFIDVEPHFNGTGFQAQSGNEEQD